MSLDIDIQDTPIAIRADELHAATCLRCRGTVWHWERVTTVDRRAATFDLEQIRGDVLLSLHGCHYEDVEPDEVDDPDYGWVV